MPSLKLKQTLIDYASYHYWAYKKLYAIVDQLSDNDYKKDCHLFFNSIHNTLNHLLLVDKLWYSRCRKLEFNITSLDQELIQDRQALKDAIFEQANQWSSLVSTFPEHSLDEIFHYTNTEKIAKHMPYHIAFFHVFNHGTHHRGQISAALTQLKLEAPVMDFVYFIAERSSK